MTPFDFEQAHQADWRALEQQLQAAQRGRRKPKRGAFTTGIESFDAARLAMLYRRSCEHLALARSRSYPIGRIQMLESLTQRAHQLIYRPSGGGWGALRSMLRDAVPAAVRRHRRHLLLATLAFALPLLAMLAATRWMPELVLTVMDASQTQQYEQMYAPDAQHVGRLRSAGDDVTMFGFYIGHNIGIAFKCFASGLLLGLGSLFYLLSNGAQIGAVAGYVTAIGHGGQFWPFVATHSSFELTAIVISGAAGLRLGQAALMPGRLPRGAALAQAGRDTLPLVAAAIVLLLLAAATEAFWSSAAWVQPGVKYTAAALCWPLVMAYLAGRFGARPMQDAHAD
ncbi:MAG TPA: stage II sporulation protein M [Ideonella sp.]|uniref:stage II sporulation protein M n=1 Tax=Ideonella sp. TaxID=1929293 RepID=UPI002C0888E8|nr:stage II sporulation protein M [Ideonella sp.]HSI49394.1 stage II sporulation protein M [Ideonella sp.]